MGGLGVIGLMFMMMVIFDGCAPKNTIEFIKLDHEKYSKCLMDSMHEARDLDLIKKECEKIAEIKE